MASKAEFKKAVQWVKTLNQRELAILIDHLERDLQNESDRGPSTGESTGSAAANHRTTAANQL